MVINSVFRASMLDSTTAIVIDDDKETVSVFCEYMRGMGIDVRGFGYNGKQAVELYERLRPDVVFLDLIMPEYDGFYALDRLRRIDPDSKVIVITANHLTGADEARLVSLNPTRVVTKPFDVNDILRFVSELGK